ncbi:MAG: thiamine phosphate synthase [Ammonifex sp.]|nr:MAG: thiamine phosphate synthase [Ammonifex sp.]
MENDLLRVVDVNLNRAREGLRVLEDLARLQFRDAALAEKARLERHELKAITDRYYHRLLPARDVSGDFGAAYASNEHDNSRALVTANVRRVQEAARVLEETARNLLPEAVEAFKRLRYAAYELEKDFAEKMAAEAKVLRLRSLKLYVIVGTAHTTSRPVGDVARAAIEGGAGMIQLREKVLAAREFFESAQNLRDLTRSAGIPLIINDRLDIAAVVGADGVHLGQTDLPVSAARRLLGDEAIVGVSTHSVDEAVTAERQGADYIGVGPVFATPTKPNVQPVGPALLTEVLKAVRVPVVAIGGITADNVGKILATGVSTVAVISAVSGAVEVAEAARLLRRLLEGSI